MNSRWGHAIIDELSAAGVGHFFVCPGSRSTPLALAVAEQNRPLTIHYDERGAAFAALGYGSATGMPAAWITTSGTAVANGLPAVVEASIANIPLALVTADRPPELRNTGANQTIDQVEIFGAYVREFYDIPPPGEDLSEVDLRLLVRRALTEKSNAPGPVHFNCMFREPLVTPSEVKLPVRSGSTPGINAPVEIDAAAAGAEDFSSLAAQLRDARRSLFVVGGGLSETDEKAIASLAEKVGAPILADVRSGLRIGGVESPCVVHNFDLLLQSQLISERPEVVVHAGDRMTSKFVYAFLNEDTIRQSRIDRWGKVVDPDRRLDSTIDAEVCMACRAMADLIAGGHDTAVADAYVKGWQRLSAAVEEVLPSIAGARDELTEPSLAFAVSRLIPEGGNLMLAASMPVRDMDTFACIERRGIRVYSNRGASGIDGTVATACGIAVASERPTVVITGDLALLHDLNSLALVPEGVPFTIVVINNDGGGIFSFLPVAGMTPHFERMFGTPHGLTFEGAAEMFRFRYEVPQTLSEFENLFLSSIAAGRTLIEVRTDRTENVNLHRTILEKVANVVG